MHVRLNLRHAGHAQSGDIMRWCAGQPRDPTTRQSIRSVTLKAKRTSQPTFSGLLTRTFEFDNYWTATLSVDGHPTVFKLDTGASVSVISSKEPWLQGQQLQPSRKILRGPGGSTLSSSGTLTVNLSYHGRTIKVYILSDQPCSLLSKQACVELGMVKRIDTLANSSTPDFINTKGQDGAGEHGKARSHLIHHRTNQLVLRHSGRTKTKWLCSHLCGPHPPQQGRAERGPPNVLS